MTPQEIADKRLPGPFGLYSYLQHVLIPDTWGEEIILTLVSMMWQMGITMVYAETMLQAESGDTTGVWKQLIWCWGTHLHWCWCFLWR